MKQILLGLLIFLIIAPVACAETCDHRLQIGEEGTCGNYKIRHDYWTAGDQVPHQIAHFHLWRVSPPMDLGSDSIDMLHEEGKYYDDNKLHVKYTGRSTDPMRARYIIKDLTPQLVVKGNLYCTDRNLNDVPMKWATVGLWDYDYSDGICDNLSSAVLTDETGYFEFSPVENVDWDADGGKLDIVVQFVAASGTGCVRDANGDKYQFIRGPYPAVSDELCMSWHTPDDETHYKAWWVYDTLCQGCAYLANTVGYGMDGVAVYWQWGHDADFGCGFDGTHAHGDGFGSTEPCIHLDGREHLGDGGGHANDPDVIIHEYGHCVMYKVFGDYWPPVNCSQGHQMYGVSEPGCAWTEGWAHFSALAVFDDEYFTDNTYGHSYNLETRDNGSFPAGDSCEGNVAAALWDIYDDHDEMYDRLTDNFNNIWDVLQNQTTDEDTFKDFYDSWCALGHDKSKANSAIFQNDIDYNLPPSVAVANPEPGKVYFGIIHTLTYTTDEDGDVTYTEFWYSRDNSVWHILDLPLGSSRYPTVGTTGEEKWWYVDWDTEGYIDEDDSVWVRVYATDDLGAVSCDDTDGPFTVDNVDPHHWRDFAPTDWVGDQTPDCMIEVKDVTAGLDVSAAYCKYSTDGGTTWGGWISASCTGSDGTTSYQTITATAVPFNHDSRTQNKIKFKIDDVAGNTGESDEYTVKIDATDPPASVISSSTHPDEDEWYSGNDPSFIWTTPPDTSGIDCYSYIFDQSATTTPDMTCDTTESSESYTDVADGIWYFHIRAKDNAGNWGSVDQYRVKIGGEASTTDAAIALQIAASGGWDANADVSGDGSVTSLDALMILQAAAGAINL